MPVLSRPYSRERIRRFGAMRSRLAALPPFRAAWYSAKGKAPRSVARRTGAAPISPAICLPVRMGKNLFKRPTSQPFRLQTRSKSW
jgi:hypothetical protein